VDAAGEGDEGGEAEASREEAGAAPQGTPGRAWVSPPLHRGGLCPTEQAFVRAPPRHRRRGTWHAGAMDPSDTEPYGTRMIREARLEAFENRRPDRDCTILLTLPEFTCLCPRSGFPDFATLHIRYVPGPRCVELRSLKLYVNGYRDRAVFHEDVVNLILDDLVGLLEPRFLEIVGDFNVRGNVHTVVRAVHRSPGWEGEPLPWWRAGPQPSDGFPDGGR
jgi:7-cyano-7-deazaguanine reductase